MDEKIPVAVLAATGAVGQRFVQLLDGHPWFQVVALTGSERRQGQAYGETCRWVLTQPMPSWAVEMPIMPSDPEILGTPLVFSALPAKFALEIEPNFARAGVGVCTNAGAFRRDPFVPILLPEINSDHVSLIERQREVHGWRGMIVCNPNCTSTGMAIVLKILDGAFGVRQVFAVSLQAASGAGYPGVPSLDLVDNIVPNIANEEEKVEWEPRKILGTVMEGQLSLHPMEISVHTNRVPVSDGHTVCLSAAFERSPAPDDVRQVLQAYQPGEQARGLPSTPSPVIDVRPENDRPQPRLDRMAGGGMTTVVGRIRPDPLLDVKLVVLSHNTIRGAAGGSLYNAEFLVKAGLIQH